MQIAKIVGSLWATVCNEHFKGCKLMLARPYNVSTGKPTGKLILAVDTVGAGVGELVLILYEGGSSRQILENPKTPCEALVVGIIDEIEPGSAIDI